MSVKKFKATRHLFFLAKVKKFFAKFFLNHVQFFLVFSVNFRQIENLKFKLTLCSYKIDLKCFTNFFALLKLEKKCRNC